MHQTSLSCLSLTSRRLALLAAAVLAVPAALMAQTPAQISAPPAAPQHYTPAPAFDMSSMDATANPCNDFYKYSCGNFAENHPSTPPPTPAARPTSRKSATTTRPA
jgi:putative endopeptidase